MIENDGVHEFSIWGLAREAGVTTPLIYNYFSSRHELLESLLQREYATFIEDVNNRPQTGDSLETLVHKFVQSCYEYHHHGKVLTILENQPGLSGIIPTQRKGVALALERRLIEEFSFDVDQARMLIVQTLSVAVAVGKLTSRKKQKYIDDAVRFVIGGYRAIADVNK